MIRADSRLHHVLPCGRIHPAVPEAYLGGTLPHIPIESERTGKEDWNLTQSAPFAFATNRWSSSSSSAEAPKSTDLNHLLSLAAGNRTRGRDGTRPENRTPNRPLGRTLPPKSPIGHGAQHFGHRFQARDELQTVPSQPPTVVYVATFISHRTQDT